MRSYLAKVRRQLHTDSIGQRRWRRNRTLLLGAAGALTLAVAAPLGVLALSHDQGTLSNSQPASSPSPASADSSLPETPEEQSSASSSANVSVEGGSNTQVTINGQNVPMPASGSINQTVPGGDTDVNVSVSNDGSDDGDSSNSSSSSLNVNLESNSSSTGGGTQRSKSNVRIRQR